MDYNIPMNTAVELPEFIRRAEKLLRNPEWENLIRYLAANPEAGVRVQAAFGNCAGTAKAREKAAVSGLSTIFTVSNTRCFC